MENSEVCLIDQSFSFKTIKLVDENGVFYSSISTNDAKFKANKAGLNLVCFKLPQEENDLPLCKIIDYHKWKYNDDKFKKHQSKMSKQDVKEIRFSSSISANDIKHKVRQLKNITEDGGIGIICMEVNFKYDKQKSLAYEKINEILGYCNEFSKITSRKENDGRILINITKK